MSRHWAEDFVGLPYGSADCALLVERVLKERLGFAVTLPTEARWGECTEAQARDVIIDMGKRVETLRECDAVLMRQRGAKRDTGTHIGLWVDVQGQAWVLHAVQSRGAILTPLRSLAAIGYEVEGIYRWTE